MANDKKALLPLIVALVASLLCFCSPLPAFADDAADDSPAYEVWQQYKDSSVTEFNLYKQVAEDLAYRWFMADSDKRAKVPLQSAALGSYKQLSQYAEDYDTPDEQWQAFYNDFHPSYIVRMYSLVTYEDSMATWGVSDNYAYQHFKEWYDWFRVDDSASGGSGSDMIGDYYVYQVDHVLDQSAYDALGDKRYEWIGIPKDIVDACIDGGLTYINYCYSDVYQNGTHWTGIIATVQLIYQGGNNGYNYPTGTWQRMANTNSAVVQEVTVTDTELGSGVLVSLRDYGSNVPDIGSVYWGNWGNVIYLNNTVAYLSQRLADGQLITYDPSGGDPIKPVYPEPVTPDLPTPSNPIYVDNDNTTTTVDLTPILDALRAINTNIMAGFTAIEADLAAFAEYLGEWQETLWRELRSANAWLERIFYKTGGGSSDGPDITIDGDGWWDWLSTIAGLLLGDLAGAVSGLAGAFDVLRGLFPFSVPWDLAALLGLFASDPVTPVFDLPVPFGYANGALQSAGVHVDLSAWDNVMVAVRSVELAIFALGLALKTRELLKNAEVEQ